MGSTAPFVILIRATFQLAIGRPKFLELHREYALLLRVPGKSSAHYQPIAIQSRISVDATISTAWQASRLLESGFSFENQKISVLSNKISRFDLLLKRLGHQWFTPGLRISVVIGCVPQNGRRNTEIRLNFLKSKTL